MKILVVLLLVGLTSPALAKAYFSQRDEMIQRADFIAVVKITKVKNLQPAKSRGNQEATATVEKVIKGEKMAKLSFFVPCFYPCAITSVSEGRYLVFLKKNHAKAGAAKSERGRPEHCKYSGCNWRYSYRPIKDGKLKWYVGNNGLTLGEKALDKALQEIQDIVKKQQSGTK